MSFTSFQYALFLPIVFIIYWKISPKYQWIVILISSYCFYMSWNVKYVILILGTTVISYFAALVIDVEKQEKVRRLYLVGCIILCIGILYIFKYFNFSMNILRKIFEFTGEDFHTYTLDFLLPVGVSFYTFQTMGYVIDVYRGTIKPERNIGRYAAFISFFPQLVAGPIERSNNLLPQINEEHIFRYTDGVIGLRRILWGLFKKICIADVLATYSDPVFNNPYKYQGGAFIIASFFFTLQIYCDFSGYSDIAIGSARLFGINLMENFRCPYLSGSIRDFWARWHISLSTWFRDYLYIPLGGNKKGKLRKNLNTIITFTVSGLWHGANFTFLLWGLAHGIAQVFENLLVTSKKHRVWRIIPVFFFCSLAWVLFRANSFNDAKYIYASIFNSVIKLSNIDLINEVRLLGIDIFYMFFILICLVFLFVYDYTSSKYQNDNWIYKIPKVFRIILYYIISVMIIFSAYNSTGSNPFVYFQF